MGSPPNTLTSVLQRVDQNGPGGCWLWQGAIHANGYGSVRANGRRHQIHRLIYEWIEGPIPDGLQLDHLCMVKACCNPDHLEPVTNDENLARYWATVQPDAYCRNGHPLINGNVYTPPKQPGRRVCQTCRRDRDARRKEQQNRVA